MRVQGLGEAFDGSPEGLRVRDFLALNTLDFLEKNSSAFFLRLGQVCLEAERFRFEVFERILQCLLQLRVPRVQLFPRL